MVVVKIDIEYDEEKLNELEDRLKVISEFYYKSNLTMSLCISWMVLVIGIFIGIVLGKAI